MIYSDWKASIDFIDMLLFEKKIHGHNIKLLITRSMAKADGVEGFINEIETLNNDIEGNIEEYIEDKVSKNIKNKIADEVRKDLEYAYIESMTVMLALE